MGYAAFPQAELPVVAPTARTWNPAVVSDPVAAARAVTAEELLPRAAGPLPKTANAVRTSSICHIPLPSQATPLAGCWWGSGLGVGSPLAPDPSLPVPPSNGFCVLMVG